VTNEIDAFISEEENAFLEHYSEENHEVEVFPLDYDIQAPADGSRFNPLIHNCASEIAAAFGDCWVEVKAFMSNSPHPLPPLHLVERGEGAGGWGVRSEYSISIQPVPSLGGVGVGEYTPNDIQLKLKSLGYTPIFKKFLPASRWVYFDVSYKGRKCALSSTNGIAFELSSTVSSKEPPEFERYSEPATDSELPF
jgi:hypothetical protein